MNKLYLYSGICIALGFIIFMIFAFWDAGGGFK